MNATLPSWLARAPVPWRGDVRKVTKLTDEDEDNFSLSDETKAKMRAAAKARCRRRDMRGTAIGRVLAFVERHPGVYSRSMLIAGLKAHTITNALSDLHTQGLIRREGQPWRYRYFATGKQ